MFNIDKIVLKIFIQLLFLFYASAEGTSRNMKIVVIVNYEIQHCRVTHLGRLVQIIEKKKHSVIYC